MKGRHGQCLHEAVDGASTYFCVLNVCHAGAHRYHRRGAETAQMVSHDEKADRKNLSGRPRNRTGTPLRAVDFESGAAPRLRVKRSRRQGLI